MVCYVCHRERPAEKLDGRRREDRQACYRWMAEHIRGRAFGVLSKGQSAGMPRFYA